MIDTTTPMGRALYGIVAVFAQLRVDTIRHNTQQLAADRVAALSAKTTPPLADVAAKNKWFEPEG